jgi:hypothetical protein
LPARLDKIKETVGDTESGGIMAKSGIRRSRTFRARISKGMQKHKTATMLSVVWILSTISGSFANVLTDLNGFLQLPYEWISRWSPGTDIGKWVLFNASFWPIAGFILLLQRLGVYGWSNWIAKVEEEPVSPLVLYKEEFAAAVEAIDQVNGLDKKTAIEDLLYTVAETIGVNLGLRKKDYRMMFFTLVPEDQKIAAFRIGRHFELVERGQLDSDSFYPRDIRLIKECLKEEETELVIPNIPFGDVRTVLFTRNPGRFRFGLYIGVLKADFDTDVAKEVFPQVAHIVSMLGFLDEMIEYMRKCE